MTDKNKTRKQLRFVIGIVLSLVALAVMILFIDGKEVAAAFKKVNILLVAPLSFCWFLPCCAGPTPGG
jgi:hypothetical protein